MSSALEMYLDFLETSTSSNQENHSTPHIDTVLHLYRQRRGKDESRPAVAERNGETYESRLLHLEKQLTDLLTRSKVNTEEKRKSITSTPIKEISEDTSTPSPPKHKTKIHLMPSKSAPLRSGRKVPVKKSVSRSVSSTCDDRKKKNELLKGSNSSSKYEENGEHSLKALTLELDAEREHRWKAEQAASRLLEHVHNLQSRVTEVERSHELVIVRGSQLEKELSNERGTNQTLQKQIQRLQDTANNLQNEKEMFNSHDQQQRKLLHDLEENYHCLETEKRKEVTVLRSRVQESETLVAGHQRELEVVKKSLKHSKTQLHQLQELLIKREEEHQKEKKNCLPLGSKEVQELIESQVLEERKKNELECSQLLNKLSEQQKAYQSLEDEFRMGLRIEAGRYSELEKLYCKVSSEVDATRQTAVLAVQKERKAVAMLSDLTDMVKEQKEKISELSRSKQEMIATLKERLSELEVQVADKNKIEARMLSLQEENSKLHSRVSAQESVIDGLREERKLWGKELAHQGASLAQERGRMEAQLESLTEETKSLRQELQKERDAVRVKEKQLDDHAHSLQQLKQSLSEKEEELQGGWTRYEKEIRDLKIRLEQEEATNMDMQDEVGALLERKEQLKEELASVEEEKEQWKAKFNKLNSQWEGKVKAIGSLEENLLQLQKSFAEKEKQLLLERDQALQSASDCEQRLKACDDAFREQLEAKEKVYHTNISRLVAERNKELESSNQRVESVEEEMRELLQEVARERKNMEAKFLKLSTVMHDLQQDITDH